MSFPDDYKIEGTRPEMRDQIGNAVPVRFATAIGKTIMESYRRYFHPPETTILIGTMTVLQDK